MRLGEHTPKIDQCGLQQMGINIIRQFGLFGFRDIKSEVLAKLRHQERGNGNQNNGDDEFLYIRVPSHYFIVCGA